MVTLGSAVTALYQRFGSSMAGDYVPGKTVFRDALCEEFDISEVDAEIICDSLEREKAIRFVSSPEIGEFWTIEDPTTTTASTLRAQQRAT